MLAWVIKRMRTCERYFMLAGTSRNTIWDAIAGNTGQMMFCFLQSVALSLGSTLDLSKSSNTDERDFEGSFVLEPKPGCYKGVVVIDGDSLYGSIMSKHGIIGSKTCGEITMYSARYYLRAMVKCARSCGYVVLYGDTDSIFVSVKRGTESSCMTTGVKVADVKGNYKSIVISAKKKYEAVRWDGTLETKGLAIVKKNSLPIVSYVLSQVMSMLNSDDDDDETKSESLLVLVGRVMNALQSGRLPVSSQVTETKIKRSTLKNLFSLASLKGWAVSWVVFHIQREIPSGLKTVRCSSGYFRIKVIENADVDSFQGLNRTETSAWVRRGEKGAHLFAFADRWWMMEPDNSASLAAR